MKTRALLSGLVLTFMLVVMSGLVMANSEAYDYNIVYGTLVSGDLNSTFVIDGDYLRIQELNTEPSLTVDFFFNNAGVPNHLFVNARYLGGQEHYMIIQVFDFNTSTFVNKGFMPNSEEFLDYDIVIDADNILLDEVIVRFLHSSGAHPNHYLDVDYISVQYLEEEVVEDESAFFNFPSPETATKNEITFMIIGFIFLIGVCVLGLVVRSKNLLLVGLVGVFSLGLAMLLSGWSLLISIFLMIVPIMLMFEDLVD